ncbi:MAG: DegT/DnrJ/EryC1/StrS family aminotransferase [Solidesulfovibrio sp.]|uniref:DegT/DnrJ/EryC1/StrS family aminotransferase n=1 Tax=Solidesulfovibrio sp. TaxID=2910990 RepID=UPI002B1EC01F|nr:DegT/DnrJ/EryC1/StrS family aminotransferase [Solidesulfovibrio sp.]MEA4855051.1 DegT/DnrJ/EryC1/StrS family aminotransferase [Solidesulfovibrio sp.]
MADIPVALPDLGEAEARAAAEAVASGWVTQGPRVAAFERAFAAVVGSPFACAVSSCTAALHLALVAVGVGPGDVVVTVSHSFIATANAVRYCGAEPVFLDIDPASGNLDPRELGRFLDASCALRDGRPWYGEAGRLAAWPQSPLHGLAGPVGRVGAILVVHQVGMPADMAAILGLARPLGIPVVEDAACAAGSALFCADGTTLEPVGRPHGDVACFSFHPRKVITTGDGGMLTTANPDYDRRFRLLRQHGMSVSDAERHKSASVVFERYLETGYNYRLTDIQAAVGLVQLGRLAGIVQRRRALAERYLERLAGLSGVVPPREPAWGRTNWQSFVVALAEPDRRTTVMQSLKDQGISTRRAVMCAHLEPPYQDAWPVGCLPRSEWASASGIVLPLYASMAEADVDRVVEGLRQALAG